MGELITQNDPLLHLPTSNPLYPHRVLAARRAGRAGTTALRRWEREAAQAAPLVQKRLQRTNCRKLAANHVISQSVATADPPAILWCQGSVGDAPYLVVVGPRNPSSYAVAVTRQLISALAPYCTVVSGMAYGIDALALQTALAAGGSCVALSPSGVETPVPAGSVPLVQSMVQSGRGALVSEYVFTTQLGAQHFIHRNRLLAAIATVLLVVEAAPRSGTMTTARLALERGTAVAVVPGDITRPTAVGSNGLIRDGAAVVLQPADLAVLLGVPWRERQYPVQYRALVIALERGRSSLEELAETLSLDLKSLTRLLLAAEQDSIVSRDQFGAITLLQG